MVHVVWDTRGNSKGGAGGRWDYLAPSIVPAQAYLDKAGRMQWGDEVTAMIDEHHKLRRYTDDHIRWLRSFAGAIWLTRGLLKSGFPGGFVKDVKAAFPDASFHKYIIGLQVGWLPRHPLRPICILKW